MFPELSDEVTVQIAETRTEYYLQVFKSYIKAILLKQGNLLKYTLV